MNWRRAVRFVAAAVGLSCAVALFMLYRPREATPPPPPVIPNADPTARTQGLRGKVIYNKGARELYIFFETSRDYPDGRSIFEKTHIVFDDKKYEVWADRVETKGSLAPGTKPTKFDLAGNVRLVGQDGMAVQTAAATYDDASGILEMPGDVTYARGRLSGTGVGGTYNRAEDSMRLADKAVAHVAPDDVGAGAAELAARSMSLMRAQHSVHLDGNATIKGERETLAGDNAIILFTDDEQAMKFLELRGHASVTPTAAAKDRPTDMRADNITLSFQPDGSTLQHATLTGAARLGLTDVDGRRSIAGSWIDLFTGADGKTVTRLDARDHVVVDLPPTKETPARTIRAASLSAKGEEPTGLQSALFNGDVVFEERQPAAAGRPAALKTGKSAWLMLQLAGDLGAVTEAEFRVSVEFVDGSVTAYAERARYEVRDNILRLYTDGTDGKRPWVEDDGLELAGGAIVVRMTSSTVGKGGHELNARGAVTSKIKPSSSGTATRRSSSLFDEKSEMRGSAEEAIYAGGEVTYIGTAATPASLFQDKSRIAGSRIVVNQDTGNLVATGSVETTFTWVDASKPAGDTKGPTGVSHATADKLDYDDAKRIATYTGQLVRLKTDEVLLEGERVVLTLGEDARSVTNTEASGKLVYAKLKEGHEFLGIGLRFDATAGTYMLTGAPARLKVATGPPCLLLEASKLLLDPKTGDASSPGGSRSTTTQVPCGTPLRELRPASAQASARLADAPSARRRR